MGSVADDEGFRLSRDNSRAVRKSRLEIDRKDPSRGVQGGRESVDSQNPRGREEHLAEDCGDQGRVRILDQDVLEIGNPEPLIQEPFPEEKAEPNTDPLNDTERPGKDI